MLRPRRCSYVSCPFPSNVPTARSHCSFLSTSLSAGLSTWLRHLAGVGGYFSFTALYIQCHNVSKLAYVINKLRSNIESIHNIILMTSIRITIRMRFVVVIISALFHFLNYADACATHLSRKEYINMIRYLIDLKKYVTCLF